MAFDDLTDANFLLYAAKCYDKPNCIQSEFEDDYRIFRYIKRLLQRYRNTNTIKERLILNHLILCQNVFGIEGSTRMLFFKIDPKDWSTLKTLLLYTSAMPKVVKGVRGKDIMSSDIPLDMGLAERLRSL